MAYKKHKELIDEYMVEVAKINHFKSKRPFDVIRLSDGSLLAEENDGIITKFCFGWSNLWPSMGSYSKAREDEADCLAHPTHFLNENIEHVRKRVSEYMNNPIQVIHYWGIEDTNLRVAYPVRDGKVAEDAELVTDEHDLEQIRVMIEAQFTHYLDRLNTYLKKYGLSKLDTWTFCYDD